MVAKGKRRKELAIERTWIRQWGLKEGWGRNDKFCFGHIELAVHMGCLLELDSQ